MHNTILYQFIPEEFWPALDKVVERRGAYSKLQQINIPGKVNPAHRGVDLDVLLGMAFRWNDSPQGFAFWHHVSVVAEDKDSGQKRVQRIKLSCLFRQVPRNYWKDLWGVIKCCGAVSRNLGIDIQPTNPYILLPKKVNLDKTLIRSFNWEKSPQGPLFWHAMYRSLMEERNGD